MKTIDDLIDTLNRHQEFNSSAHAANVFQNQVNDKNLETINNTLQQIKLDLNNFFKVQQKQFGEERVRDLENKREAERAAAGGGAPKVGKGGTVINTEKPEEGFFEGKFGFLALATGLTAAVSGYIVGLTKAIATGFEGLVKLINPNFTSIAASFKSFFEPIARIARALTDVLSKGGTGQFLKGDTYKVFGKFTEVMYKISDTIAKFVKSSGNLGARVGKVLEVMGNFFRPILEIPKALSLGGASAGGGMLQGLLKTLGSIGGYFGTIFKVFSKAAVPLTVIIASVKAIYESVTEATGFFDGVFSLIKNLFKELVSAFVTFPMELIKDIISWIAGALGFEGIEAALDSFDIDSIFRNIVDGIYDGIKSVLSNIGRMLNPLNWFGKDTQDDIDSETKKLEKDVQDAKADAADLANAYAVSDDGSYQSTVTLSSNTYEQNKELSEQELKSKGYKLATPKQRQQMQQAADDRVAQAEAALKEHQDVSSVVSAVQPMNLFKHIGNLFGGEEEPQAKEAESAGKRGMSLGGVGSPSVNPITGKRGMVIPTSPIISGMSDGVGDLLSRGQSIFTAAASGAMDFGGQALGTAREFGGQAVDAAGDAFDTVSETVGGAAADAISAVKDKASQLFDPIKNAFTNMVDMVKGVFDLSKIKMMLTNMFAEIGVPRVEFDVPIIGKVGFGPFYPFRPDAGATQVQGSSSVSTDGTGGKSTTSSTSGITEDQVISKATNLQREERVNELGETEVVETSSTVGAAFDDATGRGTVTFETGKTIDNLVTDQFQELDNAIETFDVGPIAMGKVRRMIDAGATPEQVKEFLKENEKTIADKISGFLSPLTDKAKELAGQATEAANPFESLDEDTKDEIDAIRASLFSLRGGQDSLGNTDNAQLEGPNEQSEQLQQTIDKYVKDAADLAGMTPEEFLEAEKVLDAAGVDAGRTLNYDTDFDFDPFDDVVDTIAGAGSTIGDAASSIGFGAMDQVDALSDFAGGAFKQARAAMIDNPYANLDEETQDKLGALRSSLRMIRGEEDAAGNITTDAQLEGTIEKGEGFLKAERDLEQQIADLTGMSLEDSRAAEKLVAEKNFLLGGELSSQGAEDFDFGDIYDSGVEPTPSRALSAPVGQASQEIAAEQSSATVNAPVTNANVNNSQQTNNVYNHKTIAPPPQARSTDPTFQRAQNANFGGL